MIVALLVVLVTIGSVIFHMWSPWWWSEIASNWQGMDDKINQNRERERQGNFAMAFWDNDNYVIVGSYQQANSYLFKLNKHLEKEYKNYNADIIKNFSFNSKGQPVMGDDFMINGKIH